MLVVPECHSAPALANELGVSFAWKGRYPIKGLGVFAFGGWTLEPAEETTPLPWILPLRLIDRSGAEAALLLAIWTVANAADRWPSYAAQVRWAIDTWAGELSDGNVILAGDTNCSAQAFAARPHLENVRTLGVLGVRSAYHAHHDVEHGEESEMTLRWIGPGSIARTYHCDFVFLSASLRDRLNEVSVGGMDEWIASGLSDHAPVVVRLDPKP